MHIYSAVKPQNLGGKNIAGDEGEKYLFPLIHLTLVFLQVMFGLSDYPSS